MEELLLMALRKIKTISDYQFGPPITDILFDNIDKINISFSKNTGRIRHVFYENKLLLNFRPTNGLFTLTMFSAQKIIKNTNKPKLRIIVLNEISNFIKKGRNVFCKHVMDVDNNLRALDEVIVVNEEDELLAIGKLFLPIPYIRALKIGIAVKVRKGLNKSKI